jgi:23S rRNA (pseudouridine1915-N3)-methyltransferase
MSIRVIAVGKKHEPWVVDGIGRYMVRLRRPFDVEWVYLSHSAKEGLSARQEESERILTRLRQDDLVVLLDERGRLFTSPQLSEVFRQPLEAAKPVVCIIGGAYGVDERLMERADIAWSLSPLVFPHQLVRLILAEQLYRAQEISKGNPYHHD